MNPKILGEAKTRETIFKAIGLDGKRIEKKETWVFFRDLENLSQERKNQ